MNFDCPLPLSCIFDSNLVPGNYIYMNSVQPALLEHILERISVGVLILDCVSLRILYVNTYLQSILPSSWQIQNPTGYSLRNILPDEEFKIVKPILQEVCLTGRDITLAMSHMKDFWRRKTGRTYWHITVERPQSTTFNAVHSEEHDTRRSSRYTQHRLFITI